MPQPYVLFFYGCDVPSLEDPRDNPPEVRALLQHATDHKVEHGWEVGWHVTPGKGREHIWFGVETCTTLSQGFFRMVTLPSYVQSKKVDRAWSHLPDDVQKIIGRPYLYTLFDESPESDAPKANITHTVNTTSQE